MKENKSLYIFIFLILSIIVIAITGCSRNVVKAINDQYTIKRVEGTVRIYESNLDADRTVANLINIKKPYNQNLDEDKKILLYKNAVIVVKEDEEGTEIELIENHQVAYNRHSSYMGGYVIHSGRINTPGSVRTGSSRTSSSRSGGFSFGK
ncbi:DUF4247 domain-containing protein [Natronospora cellulosivora (SeqCode)]